MRFIDALGVTIHRHSLSHSESGERDGAGHLEPELRAPPSPVPQSDDDAET